MFLEFKFSTDLQLIIISNIDSETLELYESGDLIKGLESHCWKLTLNTVSLITSRVIRKLGQWGRIRV